MKSLILIVDQYLRGRIALAFAVVVSVLLVLSIFYPLPWRRFPDVLSMARSSWLYLIIACSIAYSGMMTLAGRTAFPMTGLTCVIVGLIWKYTELFWFLPFNFSHYVLIYGLGALAAHGLRRSDSTLRKPKLGGDPLPRSEGIQPVNDSTPAVKPF